LEFGDSIGLIDQKEIHENMSVNRKSTLHKHNLHEKMTTQWQNLALDFAKRRRQAARRT